MVVARSRRPVRLSSSSYGAAAWSRYDDWRTAKLADAVERLEDIGSSTDLSPDVYALLLRRSGEEADLETGLRVHRQISSKRLDRYRFLANVLVEMYGNQGELRRAEAVFDGIDEPNVFSWTILSAAYARNGHFREALELFWSMQAEGLKPDRVAFLGAVDACSGLGELGRCAPLHECLAESGLLAHIVVGNAMVDMYAKCSSLADAKLVFDSMPVKNVISWTALLVAYAVNGQGRSAVECFWKMDAEGIKPNLVTFVSILDVCATLKLLEQGRLVHRRAATEGLESDIILGSALVNMYGKCGSLDEMRSMFSRMSRSNVVSWTALIAAFAQNSESDEAVQVIRKMDLEGVKPTEITYISMLDGCSTLDQGKEIDARIVESPFSCNKSLKTSLVNVYGKLGSLEDAKQMLSRGFEEADGILWNAMIGACAQNGDASEALQLLKKMDLEGVRPDKITYVGILEACAHSGQLAAGRAVHARILQDASILLSEVIIWNCLVNMYGKCGSLGEARHVFHQMNRRDVVSWNVMINVLVLNGEAATAVELFHRMELEAVKPNRITFVAVLEACGALSALPLLSRIHNRIVLTGLDNVTAIVNSIVNMYSKCGSVGEAKQSFDGIKKKDVISWSSMLGGYAQNRCGRRALKLFQEMQLDGVKPTEPTFITALDACASLATLEHGKAMHKKVLDAGYVDRSLAVGNTLVNMYGRCGSPELAQAVFNRIPERNQVTWNTLIVAYAQNGKAKQALEAYHEMLLDGVPADRGTMVTILYACSHAGLLKEGLEHFKSAGEHHIEAVSELFKCMIDLLGRKGLLSAAEELIHNMPYKADIVAWMVLVGACRSYGDADRGIRAAEQVLQLDPKHAPAHVLLAQLHASAGRWAEAAAVWKRMDELDIKKTPGCSWIELKGCVHEFYSGELKHPKSELILDELQRLNRLLMNAGYVPDTRMVLHNVGEDDKVRILSHHSERLAIALGLISTPAGSTIRIMKNLRVCPDCHVATKLMSLVTGREITVRDSSRFHHFKAGSCSCGDFW